MIPEKVFHQILVLGADWRVLQVDYLNKSQGWLRVENTPALWAAELRPHCGGRACKVTTMRPNAAGGIGTSARCHRRLSVAPPRGRCGVCEKIDTVRAPWEGRRRRLTQAFEAFALTRMREMPGSKAGEILGETDTKLWGHCLRTWTRPGRR